MPYFTNSTMMEVDFLPEHLLIVGGSYVGLEFAQAYRRFGARVTVVEMSDRLIAREDEDVSDAVREILEAEGIEIRLNAKCLAVDKDGDGIVMRLDCTEGAPSVRGSHLLLAVGRRPNTDDLGLDKAGVANRCARATSSSTTSAAPMSKASGRSATSTAAAPSPTPPTTTSRSLPPICSTAIRGASPTALPATACSSIRPWAGSA